MTSAELLTEAFGRVGSLCRRALDGCDEALLAGRPDAAANSIAWLVWHLTRIQDDHVAKAAGSEQRWTSGGWCERFDLPFAPAATGYGHGPDEVALLGAVPGELLLGYHETVLVATLAFVGGLADGDLDRVVDTSYEPPVTLGVRLVSVLSDNLQHAGQAAYAKGILTRR
ncbi:MAG TPA: DinB family protein [Acidimicrobiales bacterium]|nr:DinB family protein [Acidimicrobiales bacterium]